MEVRTGDTALADRARQKRSRPHLLLTTPESLSSILSQGNLARTRIRSRYGRGRRDSFVRGKQARIAPGVVSGALGTPREAAGAAHRRFSDRLASRSDSEAALRRSFLCEVAAADIRKSHRLEIVPPEPGAWLPPAGYNSFRIAPTVATLVEQANCSLIFLTTRSGCGTARPCAEHSAAGN